MKDLVIYCADSAALESDLINNGYVDDEGGAFLPFCKTPDQIKGQKTLCLVRVSDSELSKLQSFEQLEILGTYDEVFADAAKMKKYNSVYSTASYEYTDEETGETITVTPPKKFGVFA